MRAAPVIRLPVGADRDRRIARVAEARRRVDADRGRPAANASRRAGDALGRAWINGREVGGSDARYAHLARSHD